MNLKIKKGNPEDYSEIMIIWESSVKATHNFLDDDDFVFYKKLIPIEYLPKVDSYILLSDEKPVGFIGIHGEDLEMLFIAGDQRNKSYGKFLLNYAVENLNIKKVDVNEQNFQAIEFYKKFGFRIIGRSDKDSMNKNYPILHFSL
jgi:putative acetyltransferase